MVGGSSEHLARTQVPGIGLVGPSSEPVLHGSVSAAMAAGLRRTANQSAGQRDRD